MRILLTCYNGLERRADALRQVMVHAAALARTARLWILIWWMVHQVWYLRYRALPAIICAENHLIVILGRQAVMSSQPRSSCGFRSLVPHMLRGADVYL